MKRSIGSFCGGQRIAGRLVMIGVCSLGLIGAAAALPGSGSPSGVAANLSPAPQAALTNYPAGVGEIVKMLDANVEREEIKAYVQNSFTYWNLSADDIILLKDTGVPSDIVTAMLQRDEQLRDQAVEAAQANPTAGGYGPNADTTATNVAPQNYDSSQYANSDAYPADYSYGYPGYPYPYSYPYPYYDYGYYGWPVWGGGVIFFDSFGRCHFDHNNHHHHSHDFHGHTGFRGDSFHNGLHVSGAHNGFHASSVDAFRGRFHSGAGSGFHGTTASGFRGTTTGGFHGPAASQRFRGSNVLAPSRGTFHGSFAQSSPFVTRSSRGGFMGHSSAFAPHAASVPHAFAPAGGAHFGGGSFGHMGGSSFGGGMHMGGGHGGGGGHR